MRHVFSTDKHDLSFETLRGGVWEVVECATACVSGALESAQMLRGLVFRQAFVVLDVVLAALVATAVFLIVMKRIESPSLNIYDASSTVLAEDFSDQFSTLRPRTGYDHIITSGIFGPAGQVNRDEAPPPPPPEDPEETETTLPLRLLGEVFAGERQLIATALIEVNQGGRVLKTFYIGEEILDGVVLYEVRSKEVVLDNKNTGSREVLKRDQSADRFRDDIVASAASKSPSSARSTSSNVIALDRAELTRELVENYEQIATTLDIREYLDENGNVAGLTASNVSSLEIAKKLGLKDNDVLTAINNEPITSVDQVYDVLNKYRNASTFRLGIIRNGKPQFITYRLR